jgi:SAM-dependent methyltransferase
MMRIVRFLAHKINGGIKRVIIFFYRDAFPSTGDWPISKEKRILYPYCQGLGLDVGCGSRKTHPQALGVDIVPGGQIGKFGSERRRINQANICTSGDNLYMFTDESLDYIVSRHNLEHYDDPEKTLKEWRRVLKKGGTLGVVLPDEDKVETLKLDPTHKSSFTKKSFRKLLDRVGGFKIEKLDTCIPDKSFYCIALKI